MSREPDAEWRHHHRHDGNADERQLLRAGRRANRLHDARNDALADQERRDFSARDGVWITDFRGRSLQLLPDGKVNPVGAPILQFARHLPLDQQPAQTVQKLVQKFFAQTAFELRRAFESGLLKPGQAIRNCVLLELVELLKKFCGVQVPLPGAKLIEL